MPRAAHGWCPGSVFVQKINKGYDFNYHLDALMQENLLAFGQQINEKDVRNSHADSL